jgi:hypothetical protein
MEIDIIDKDLVRIRVNRMTDLTQYPQRFILELYFDHECIAISCDSRTDYETMMRRLKDFVDKIEL